MRAVCTVREFGVCVCVWGGGGCIGPEPADRGEGEVEARLAVK